MKYTKKLVSLLLAVIMVMAMAITTFANPSSTGKITVKNPMKDQSYSIYHIFNLSGYDKENGVYAYTVNTAWSSFFGSGAKGLDYVTIDAAGNVTWKTGASADHFAKEAINYAKEKSISAINTKVAQESDATVQFTNLTLGYYLLDSTVGTLCTLTTTDPEVEVSDKNKVPTNVKEVEEDSNGNWENKNDADLMQTVNFKSLVVGQAGAKNYIFHDKMSRGLTLNPNSVVVKKGSNLTIVNNQGNINYQVVTQGLTDGCTFEVRFTETFCDTILDNTHIQIEYSAQLNEGAVIAGDGNPNESYLSYGENGNVTTTPSQTTTYTWGFNIYKYGMKNGQEVRLAGAEFVLQNNASKFAQFSVADNVYKFNGWVDNENDATKMVSQVSKDIQIKGLDGGTYYVKETLAPSGYNLLADRVEVIIKDTTEASTQGQVTDKLGKVLSDKTIKIENKSGSLLPTTGGVGTMMYYVIGLGLAFVTGTLLVTKKRTSYR